MAYRILRADLSHPPKLLIPKTGEFITELWEAVPGFQGSGNTRLTMGNG
jgi:hypothetical protein